jgi:hypothetical protein
MSLPSGLTLPRGTRIGVAVGPAYLHAVRLRGAVRVRSTSIAVEWDGRQLEPAVELLRAELGRADAVAVAIEPGALFVKRVALPPVSLSEQRRIMMLEPERFFPLRGRDVVAAPQPGSPLVFAAEADRLEAWLQALAPLGPIESVEPSPVALTRALVHHGVTDAAVLTPAGAGATAAVRIVAGSLAGVRKVRGGWPEALAALGTDGGPPPSTLVAPGCAENAAASAAMDPKPLPLPGVGSLPPDFAAAFGALLGLEQGSTEPALMPDRLLSRARARRTRRFATAVAAAVLALLFALTSVGRYRQRVLQRVDREIAALEPRAAGVLSEQAALERLTRRLALVDSARADRPDPLAVLLALTEALPRDAHLRSLHAAGPTWEIDGAAADAARLVPALERSPVIADVRFRDATSRVREGARTYEDFALAFRYVPAP